MARAIGYMAPYKREKGFVMPTPDPNLADDTLPADDAEPIFDKGLQDLPWPPEDVLPIDDDGNILPGEDTLDNDLNDNSDRDQDDPDDYNNAPI